MSIVLPQSQRAEKALQNISEVYWFGFIKRCVGQGFWDSFREQKTVPLVNHAFACGTPAIFVIFVFFLRVIFVFFSRGLSSKTLVFFWLERKFVIFAVFVKSPLVLAGQRYGFPKAPFLDPDSSDPVILIQKSLRACA